MIKYLSFFGLTLFLTAQSLLAQQFNKPHAHQVKAGETIESIAKRYFVAPSKIYALNPDAKSGLTPNTILVIPKSQSVNSSLVAKTPVLNTVQKDTIIKELQGFKAHKTKRKETLYSLSKKYGVTPEDIKKYNTFLYNNTLRKNDKLQIPVFKNVKPGVVKPTVVTDVNLNEQTPVTEVLNETGRTYTVLPKEGKWRVAYKFGITVNELETLNPNMGEVLQPGQQINVPNVEDDKTQVIDDTYSYYTVLPKEGFYRLKVKLGVEQEMLETLNPTLKESGLKEGMVLKVPFNAALNRLNTTELQVTNLENRILSTETKHIAVMLPFRLNRVDFDTITATKYSLDKDPYLQASLDFHSGVLLAVDALKQKGVSLIVDVYDTKNEVTKVNEIIKNNDFSTVDAVIGPLVSKNFQQAAQDLSALKVPIISPIGNHVKMHNHVFQSKPSDELMKKTIVNFVKKDSLTENIFIIADAKHTATANALKGDFKNAKIVYSRKNKKGKDDNYVMVDDIKDVLKPGKNIVFLETKNAGFASNATSILNSLIQKENKEEELEEISIVLVTTNKNKAFESDEISNEHLSNLSFHFATASRAYNEDNTHSFVKKYTETYHVTPNKRAVLGYDLTMDTVLRLATSSTFYDAVNEAPLTEYVEHKFAYKKNPVMGYYNDTVYLVKYNDLNIVEVKP